MKKINIRPAAFLACAAILTGCSENSWNDHLDGFEKPDVYDKTEAVKYELTDADYSTLSGLSANKALAVTDEEKAALAAIGTNKCFASEDEAHKYLPAFFENSGFPYFTANNGSSISAVYAVSKSTSPVVTAINKACPEYRVSAADYKSAWGSDEDYIEAFAPMTPAASNLPGILLSAYHDAVSGDYVVANYNMATSNPIFGSVSGGEEYEMTSVIKDVKKGDVLNIKGVVTGVSTRGFVVTDNAGSICYDQGKTGFNDDAITVGAQVTIKDGTVSSYSRCLQIAGDADAPCYTVTGTMDYNYPAPVKYDGAKVTAACEATGDMLAQYVELPGTLSVSGNYYNVNIEGTSYQGSVYNAPDFVKSQLKDGDKVTLMGYFVAVTGKAKYFNILVTGVNNKPIVASAAMTRSVVGTTATISENAVYTFNGSKWVVPSNTVVLQPSDYADMGQKYGNLSDDLPDTMLPAYMNANYHYAAEGDEMVVLYKYYSGSTKYQARPFSFTGSKWVAGVYREIVTEQYNKIEGEWMFDPSVTLTLPAVKGDAVSSAFYQACVDWVFENIDKPLGSTSIKSGVGYVTSYGNNEYYSGTSAYQNNVDLRASAALGQYPKGYEGMSNEEIVELEKVRFCTEVAPGALATLYPAAKPITGLEVLYTITFSAYSGSSTDAYTGVWKVVGPAKFEFVSCTWWADGKPAN
nr:DUF5017 domain-containing protein [uncultured Muribaculaceae bacterium]